jgi:hypothetical protein
MICSNQAGAGDIHLLPAANHRSNRSVKLVACLVLMVNSLLAGCTSLQPLADNADTLRNELRSEDIVEPGDKVRVVTRDGLSRLLIVTSLDQDILKGHPEGIEKKDAVVEIPIDDIVFMEGKKISVGKTAAYTGGATVGAAAALVIAVIIAIITMF